MITAMPSARSMTAVTFLAVALVAAPLDGQQQRGETRGFPAVGGDPIGLILDQREALRLTAEQVEQLVAVREEWTAQLAEARTRMEETRERHLERHRERMQERMETMEARDARLRERRERMEERHEAMEDRRRRMMEERPQTREERSERMEARRDMMADRRELRRERMSAILDRRATMLERRGDRVELLREGHGAMSDLREGHRRTMEAVRDILTPEQLGRFHELRSELRPDRRRPGSGDRPRLRRDH